MNIMNAIAGLITLAAVFSYINYKTLKLPTTIGILVLSLAASLMIIGSEFLGFHLEEPAVKILESIDFNEALMNGMLSALLFAGALHVHLDQLAKQKWVVLTLASVGVITSTFVIGYVSFYVFEWLGMGLPLIYCLLFGALISPTDPIAVLGILKSLGAPKSLETKIAGESLFNDGVSVVVFLVMLGFVSTDGGHHAEFSFTAVATLFAQEALGGALFGLVIGYLVYKMLSSIDQYQVEILLTLSLVLGGYTLAMALHLSGPIAIVVAGLLIGNSGRSLAMSEKTRGHLDSFWELIDEILNAVLFVLIGLELLVLTLKQEYLLAGVVMIPLVLLSRFIAVGIPITFMKRVREFSPKIVRILTWGGLRGGISLALALSLPAGKERDAILVVTYVIVVFSILIQGMTIGHLIERDPKASGEH